MQSLIVGSVLVASLAGNVVLTRMHGRDARAIETLAEPAARVQTDIVAREERDILMELIPAITLDLGLEDIEAYLGSVYSGEPIAVAEDPACIGCVVVSWRSLRFAFDETGRLAKVSSTS